MLLTKKIKLPIFPYNFEICYAKEPSDFQERFPGFIDRFNSNSYLGITLGSSKEMAAILLTSRCSTDVILHECVHIYRDFLDYVDLPRNITEENEEFHAYMLSYIQSQVLDAVLEMKSRFVSLPSKARKNKK